MAGSGPESVEGKGGVEEDDKDPQKGGVRAAGVWIFLQICHSVSADIWHGDMGDYLPHGTGTGGFPGPGGAEIDRAAPAEAVRQKVGVHLGGGGKGGI